MSTIHNPSVVLTGLGFTWPDGSVALRAIDAAFGRGRTGLIGTNGSGKSTLLRIIAGELAPTEGSVVVSADVGYLRQDVLLRGATTVADLLGVSEKVAALRAIVGGDSDARHFDALGDEWDVETKAGAALRSAGLTEGDLDRSASELSGGEATLVAVAGLRMRGAPVTVLDEPTNNLDRNARGRLAAMVRGWRGALIVVSHDVSLLELMDDTAELRDGRLTIFGGAYTAFRQHIEQEQAAAEQAERSAEQVLKTEKRQRVEAETKLARRSRYARTDFENKRKPKIIMNQRKTEAQVSAGRMRTELDRKVLDARRSLETASSRLRSDSSIHIDLPDPGVPASRRLVELVATNGTVTIQGPERVALTGPNGVGKTTLLESIVHPLSARPGLVKATAHTERIGYLAQRLDTLDESASVLDNVCRAAPTMPPGTVRNRLARFLIRGDAVDRPVSSVSGGERFRVALACLLLADPSPQLLVLDEPTNNLDLDSVAQLVSALSGFRGGLLVVSHDHDFLARLGITSWLELTCDGELRTT